MSSTRDIKRKIASVKNTQKITRAMKMVSAAKMRRAQEAMENARPYAEKITEVIENISLRVNPEVHHFLREPENVESVALLVLTSDRGLCGAFNSNVIKRVASIVRAAPDKHYKLYIVGKKADDFFKRRDYEILEKWVTFAGRITYDDAGEIGDKVIAGFNEGAYQEVHVVYNNFRSTSSQVPVDEKLLPLSFEPKSDESDDDGAPTEPRPTVPEEPVIDYLYEPEPARLLDELLPRYITFSIYSALLESMAGEHAARMLAMDNATRNADEMIDQLTLTYNKVRQAAITKEILDIVNGAEAMRG